MNMHIIDWTIVASMFTFLIIISLVAAKYNRSIADFLVANRCARRYLLTISLSTALTGTLTMVGTWEIHYETGFASVWWWNMIAPVGMLIITTGFIIYRYRAR